MKLGCMKMLIGIILVITGIFVAIKPYMAWFLLIGWQIRDAEPTDLALSIYRIVAVFLLILGFIMIIKGGFN
jgi:uncharacterized membrane protein YidH (DUF202 family)